MNPSGTQPTPNISTLSLTILTHLLPTLVSTSTTDCTQARPTISFPKRNLYTTTTINFHAWLFLHNKVHLRDSLIANTLIQPLQNFLKFPAKCSRANHQTGPNFGLCSWTLLALVLTVTTTSSSGFSWRTCQRTSSNISGSTGSTTTHLPNAWPELMRRRSLATPTQNKAEKQIQKLQALQSTGSSQTRLQSQHVSDAWHQFI